MEGAERVHPVRLCRRRVRRRLTAERVGDVRGDDPAAGAARAGEVLLGHHDHVPVRDASGADLTVQRPRRVVDEVGLRLSDSVRAALDATTRDQDRIPRPRVPHRVRPRIAPAALGRIAQQATATARPGDAVLVDVDVVRVVGQAVVAPEVDRLGEHLRIRRVAEVGDPDRPSVAAAAWREGPEIGQVVASRRPARPDIVAAVDAADRVACGKVDEVTHLLQVLRIAVGDDVKAGAAVGIAVFRPEGPDPGAVRLVDVVVTWIERADDQVAADVDVHVLVLPVPVRAEDPGRLERVEDLRIGRVADVDGLEAEAAGDDQDVAAAHLVELALDHLLRPGHAGHVLE